MSTGVSTESGGVSTGVSDVIGGEGTDESSVSTDIEPLYCGFARTVQQLEEVSDYVAGNNCDFMYYVSFLFFDIFGHHNSFSW